MNKDYAPLFLRTGLAVVFLIFGYHKLSDPAQSSAEIQLLLSIDLPLASFLNYFVGAVEIILALSLLLGFYIKYSAPIATLLIAVIFISLTYKYGLLFDASLSRDIGLIAASLALWILGPGAWSLDKYFSHS